MKAWRVPTLRGTCLGVQAFRVSVHGGDGETPHGTGTPAGFLRSELCLQRTAALREQALCGHELVSLFYPLSTGFCVCCVCQSWALGPR